MPSTVEFNHEKATQTLNFFAKKNGGSISKLFCIKLVWILDRYHLRNYGRPVTNDSYIAMKFGPVASSVKDIAECSSFLSDVEKNYLEKFISCDRENNLITSISEIDKDVFSNSEIKALDLISETFLKHLENLVQYSHYFPEWKKFKNELEGKSTREIMSYEDFFKNPDEENKDNFFSESKEKLEATKEIFMHNYKVANFWMND